MEWVKLYTRLPRDAAIRAACLRSPMAGWVYTLGLCYSGEQETDGFVSATDPPFWNVPRVSKAIQALVDEGLWTPEDGGWRIRRWLDRQESRAKLEAKRQATAERVAKARNKSSNTVTNTRSNTTRGEKTRTPPTPPPIHALCEHGKRGDDCPWCRREAGAAS